MRVQWKPVAADHPTIGLADVGDVSQVPAAPPNPSTVFDPAYSHLKEEARSNFPLLSKSESNYRTDKSTRSDVS